MCAAQGLVIGSPVYFAGANGALCALLDRAFFAARSRMAYKPGAAVVSCRRGGAGSAFDRLNKYFTINNMPVVSSQYWNSVHGNTPDEVRQDAEGLQVMRVLGRNMAWLLKSVQAGSPPAPEAPVKTNFIR
jgi:multimeric flavodoxin WrbA